MADIHKYESNKAQFQKAFPSSKVLSKLFKLGLEEIENDQAEIEKELTVNSKKGRGPRKRKYPESIVSEEELADAVVTEDENDYEQEVFHETTQMSQSGKNFYIIKHLNIEVQNLRSYFNLSIYTCVLQILC